MKIDYSIMPGAHRMLNVRKIKKLMSSLLEIILNIWIQFVYLEERRKSKSLIIGETKE